VLLILNLPLIKCGQGNYKSLMGCFFPSSSFFVLSGPYRITSSEMLCNVDYSGSLGYFMRKFEYEAAPFVIAFILSPILELEFSTVTNFIERKLQYFLTKPISLGSLIVVALLFLLAALSEASGSPGLNWE